VPFAERLEDYFDCFTQFSLRQQHPKSGFSDLIEPRTMVAPMAPNHVPLDIGKSPKKIEGNKRVMLGAENPAYPQVFPSERGGGHELLITLQRGHDMRESRRFQFFG
jgi:hypothetical protein